MFFTRDLLIILKRDCGNITMIFSRYTKGKGPWVSVLLEEYETKKEALIRENQIKKWNRRTLLKLLDKNK